jgi:hypothetical protein
LSLRWGFEATSENFGEISCFLTNADIIFASESCKKINKKLRLY